MSILGRHLPMRFVWALVAIMVGSVGLLPVWTKGQPREVALVARDMAFYLEGNTRVANPVLDVRPGEQIRIVLKNRDEGMTHNFAIPALKATTRLVSWDDDGDTLFVAPEKPGLYEYVCSPHALMMKGTLRVR